MPKVYVEEWRHHRDITMERFARNCGIPFGVAVDLEMGKVSPTPQQMEQMAAVLGISPADLLRSPHSPPLSLPKRLLHRLLGR